MGSNGELRSIHRECVECGAEFVIEVNEQLFFRRQGWDNLPRRCKPCREIRRARGIVRPGEVRRVE